MIPLESLLILDEQVAKINAAMRALSVRVMPIYHDKEAIDPSQVVKDAKKMMPEQEVMKVVRPKMDHSSEKDYDAEPLKWQFYFHQ